MRHCLALFTALSCFLLSSSNAGAEMEQQLQPVHGFKQANELYMAGDYQAAARMYEVLVAEGPQSAALHYNLANAYMKTDDLGPAVLHYRRASLLSPRDQDILHNLAHAESRLAFQPLPEVESWGRVMLDWLLSRLTMNELVGVSIALYWLTVGMAIYRTRNRRRLVRVLLWALLAAFCLSAGLSYGKWQRDYAGGKAIVLNDAEMYSGPGEGFEPLARLHAGAEVKLLQSQGRYREVRTQAGGRGWLTGDRVQLISPLGPD